MAKLLNSVTKEGFYDEKRGKRKSCRESVIDLLAVSDEVRPLGEQRGGGGALCENPRKVCYKKNNKNLKTRWMVLLMQKL